MLDLHALDEVGDCVRDLRVRVWVLDACSDDVAPWLGFIYEIGVSVK
jgi:hypothetical protein